MQWRQTDLSISAMALVVFLPRPELHSIQDIYVGFFIPQNSPPRPVGTGDPDTSLAPLYIFINLKFYILCILQYKYEMLDDT